MSKILIVDDNATNRKLLVTLLSFEGYLTIEAVDGADALAAARQHRPVLVISDILMPSMDGYEFVRRLRAEPGLAETAVIFHTADYHEREALALAEQCGVLRVLLKPTSGPQLLAAVEEAIERAPAKTAPASVSREFDAEHLRLLTDKLSEKADALRVTNARLSALIDLNVQLASERDPHTLLQKVCEGARELLGARFTVLAVEPKAADGSVLSFCSGIDPPPTMALSREQLHAGLLGKVLQTNHPHRLVSENDEPLDLGLPTGYPEARAILAVPVTSLSHTYGWLSLGDKIGAPAFSADDEYLLATMAAQVGRIYENGSLYVEVQSHATQLLVEMEERERQAKSLRASEERFRQLAENIQDVFFIQTANRSQTLYVSPAYERLWGRPAEELLRDQLAWVAALHPDDRERTVSANARILEQFPYPGALQFRIVRPDGETRWILSRIFPILDETSKVVRVVGVATDITERKAAEDNVLKLNRVYAMLSGINSLIVRTTDRRELLQEACRLSVGHGGFQAAWCGLLRPEDGQLAQAAVAGTLGTDTEQLGASIGTLDTVTEALRSRAGIISNDVRADCATDRLTACLAAGGCRALAALPLVIDAKSVGCLVLTSTEPGVFDQAEMRLLNELSGDISFALDHIDKAERLNYLAYYDALTGLANRTFLQERLAQHIRDRRSDDERLAIVVTDIDGFESFNEELGRPGGDELLRAVAARLAECVGGTDLVARTGSDEFVAMIPRLHNVGELTRIVEMWLERWLENPFVVDGRQLRVKARAGIAVFPDDGLDAAALLLNGETALRNCKASETRYAFYTSELSKTLLERRTLESSLVRALEQEEFLLYYQPKVDLETRRLTGVEALLRWQHPELGLLAPAKFISLLEENGLIVDVGAWALRQASLDRSRWLERSLPAPRVAVNVSSAQLVRDDFVRTVATIVKLAGSEAGLDLEVTESLLMGDVESNIAKLAALRDIGVGIALDDFGTGYSSLAYVAKLPLETLKIDRSFVVSMLDDPSAMTLVSTVISLAHALKLQTVAEGVESEEQAKILRLLRCDQMQGYLISKPMPFAAMTTYLSRTRN